MKITYCCSIPGRDIARSDMKKYRILQFRKTPLLIRASVEVITLFKEPIYACSPVIHVAMILAEGAVVVYFLAPRHGRQKRPRATSTKTSAGKRNFLYRVQLRKRSAWAERQISHYARSAR